MAQFTVHARSGDYPVVVEAGGLSRLGRFVRSLGPRGRAVVVSDANVAALHGPLALRSLRSAGFSVRLVTVPPGERSKSRRQLSALWDHFAASGLERGDAVVALGGGVVGDLAGLAAATYLRGVPLVMVPTSLVAQVDSSIGGKVGINLAAGKNLVGAFAPPRGVLTDPRLLATLPARQLRSGLAEVVKTGMAVDARLFEFVERAALRLRDGDRASLARAVWLAARAKGWVVSHDEHEGGLRSALNFGHTLGHALEAASGYRGLLHGEAVVVGMRAGARLSVAEVGLPERDRARLEAVLDRLELPQRMPPTPLARLLRGMASDKKRRGGVVLWVLTPRVGSASLPRPVDGRRLRAVLLELGARVVR
jgi:3-dehydroquinate synthase